MAEFPALPIFTDALLGDTQHLSQAEFGAYMLMLIVAWRTEDCSLPNDDKYLARITRSDRNWRRIKEAVIGFWTVGNDSQLRQKRLSKERLRVTELTLQRRSAGTSSALKRNNSPSTSAGVSFQRTGNEKLAPIPIPILKKEGNGVLKEVNGLAPGAQMRLEMARKGMQNIANSDREFLDWIERGYLTREQAIKAGASI